MNYDEVVQRIAEINNILNNSNIELKQELEGLRKIKKEICPHRNIKFIKGYCEYDGYEKYHHLSEIICLDCGLSGIDYLPYQLYFDDKKESKNIFDLLYNFYISKYNCHFV